MLACSAVKLEIEKKWLVGGGIGAAFLVVLAIVAWQVKSIDIPLVSEGHSAANAGSGAKAGDAPVEADLQRCVVLWNKPSNDYGRSLISGYSDQPPYVNVDFSATFSDKCLITSANPDIGRAYQFLEGRGESSGLGPFGIPVSEGSVNSLPPTEWNASSDGEGYLTLKSKLPARY